jgi:acetoacetyl-CoA synthetase
VIEEMQEINDSLVIHLADPAGDPGELLLFVVLHPGLELDAALEGRIRQVLRTQLSPRHVPDRIDTVAAIPRTASVAVTR